MSYLACSNLQTFDGASSSYATGTHRAGVAWSFSLPKTYWFSVSCFIGLHGKSWGPTWGYYSQTGQFSSWNLKILEYHCSSAFIDFSGRKFSMLFLNGTALDLIKNLSLFWLGLYFVMAQVWWKVILCRAVKVTVFMLLVVENLRSWQLRFIIFVIWLQYRFYWSLWSLHSYSFRQMLKFILARGKGDDHGTCRLPKLLNVS